MDTELIAGFGERVLNALQRMDAECSQIVGGRPAGLQAYQHPARSGNRWEESWSRGLADAIADCDVECRYPSSRRRCDLVVRLAQDQRLWLEVKGAWKHYFWNGVLKRNLSFRKHLHAAAADVEKVAALQSEAAAGVGLLLAGFDVRSFPMDVDINRLAAKAELNNDSWFCSQRRWNDPHVAGHRTNAWLWIRAIESAS